MNKLKALENLGPITDEMLGGLHADEEMRLRIKRAAASGAVSRRRVMRRIPAVCCAALVLLCAGTTVMRLGEKERMGRIMNEGPVVIDSIAAGDKAQPEVGLFVADLGRGARVGAVENEAESLFAAGEGDMPMVTAAGGVYRMLTTPQDIGSTLLGEQVGSVALRTQEPSLASEDAFAQGLSNVAQQGETVYAVQGIASSTAVAAKVDGKMRLFQRVSYAGKGPDNQTLEETFSVRGQVKTLELSGVGTLSGEKANEVVGVLLDQATLQAADASARRQTLTATLESGLKLQLGVSGDMLCGCGGWSCPEFFEAFESAL